MIGFEFPILGVALKYAKWVNPEILPSKLSSYSDSALEDPWQVTDTESFLTAAEIFPMVQIFLFSSSDRLPQQCNGAT